MTAPDVAVEHTWRTTWRGRIRRARRRPVVVAGLLAALLVAAFVLGRATATDEDVDIAATIDRRILPLIIDADGIWTSGSDDRTSVAEGLVALRHQGDASIVLMSFDQWLVAYDAILLQLAGIDLPAVARPVQRQFISAVMLSRDAVEVLGRAADATGATRTDLLVEVDRLRQRSEQLTQSARASVADLDGQRADVAPPATLPRF